VERDGEDGEDIKDKAPVVSLNLHTRFIRVGFNTFEECGKTYGKVFGGSGCRRIISRKYIIIRMLPKYETVSYFDCNRENIRINYQLTL